MEVCELICGVIDMAKRTIACRVCGKQFVPCNKSSASLGAFTYHSIACSPECGAEYLRRVQAARNQSEQEETAELSGQISIKESEAANVNVAGEISDDANEDIFADVPKAIRSRKNKQETNEEE